MECVQCETVFKTTTALRRHQLMKRKCRVKVFSCEKCNRKFSSAKSLLTHEKIYCRKSFGVIDQLLVIVRDWLSPYVNLDSQQSLWRDQGEKILRSELVDGLLSWVDYERCKHTLSLWFTLYSILEHYTLKQKYDLLKLLTTLLHQSSITEESFLQIVMQL
jgi:hypothetical protein